MPVDKSRLVPGTHIAFDHQGATEIGLIHSTYIDDLASKTVKCKILFGSSTKTVFVKQADITGVGVKSPMNSYVVPGDNWTQDQIVTVVSMSSRGLFCELRQLNQGVLGQASRLSVHMEDYPNKNSLLSAMIQGVSVIPPSRINSQWTFGRPSSAPVTVHNNTVPFPTNMNDTVPFPDRGFQIIKKRQEIDCTCDSKALVSYGCQCEYSRRKKD
jgi:hypothetical protein